MNIVLDEAVEEKNGGEKAPLGMVVSIHAKSKNFGLEQILIGSLGNR